MGDFEYKADDEVFNILTRKVGIIVSVKEVNPLQSNKKKYVRVYIKPGLPDEIWAVDEIALWTRKKKRMMDE